jgi:hypothetical protein
MLLDDGAPVRFKVSLALNLPTVDAGPTKEKVPREGGSLVASESLAKEIVQIGMKEEG